MLCLAAGIESSLIINELLVLYPLSRIHNRDKKELEFNCNNEVKPRSLSFVCVSTVQRVRKNTTEQSWKNSLFPL